MASRIYHPSELGATRIFARARAFDLACPHCGKIWRVTMAAPRLKDLHGVWDPKRARLTCSAAKRGCGRIYVVGLLIWPVARGGATTGPRTIPDDQNPTPRQLAELRNDASWWMPDKYSQPPSPGITNYTGEDERPPEEEEEE